MTRLFAVFALLATVTTAHATPLPPVVDGATQAASLHEKKRAYLQAQLDAARQREVNTRDEGLALIGTSIALPVVTAVGALSAVNAPAALDASQDAARTAAAFVGVIGGLTTCIFGPAALLTGLTRIGDAELAQEEVSARERLLAKHEAVRF